MPGVARRELFMAFSHLCDIFLRHCGEWSKTTVHQERGHFNENRANAFRTVFVYFSVRVVSLDMKKRAFHRNLRVTPNHLKLKPIPVYLYNAQFSRKFRYEINTDYQTGVNLGNLNQNQQSSQ